jgi:hypothetical protein
MLNVLNLVMMLTLGNIHIESSQRKIGLRVAGFGLYEVMCIGESEPIMRSAP